MNCEHQDHHQDERPWIGCMSWQAMDIYWEELDIAIEQMEMWEREQAAGIPGPAPSANGR